MTDDIMLKEAIAAVRKGDRDRARDLLTRLLKANQSNPDYWLWLSTVVETQRERIYCLREALQRDPKNPSAWRGLVLSGALTLEPSQIAAPGLVRREWKARPGGFVRDQKLPVFPVRRLFFWSGAGLVVTIMLLYSLFGPRSSPPEPVDYRLSPPPSVQPSATFLVTNTPYIKTATPTFAGPTPLWFFLPATYTPTPFYGETPHPRTEAYNTGVKRFNRGDWQGVITFMQQAIVNEPDAADAYYYMGEAYRMLGDFPKAVEQYDRAILAGPGFAPAYLGRARAQQAADPAANVDEDLNRAVALDPGFGEAYLALADAALQRGDAQAALQSLDLAAQLLPTSPLVPLKRAAADLALGNHSQALDEARLSNEMDMTSLASYRLLGQVLQANGDMQAAVSPLQVYLIYLPEDTGAWLMLAQSYTGIQEVEKAVDAYTRALQVDGDLFAGWLERGRSYLELGEPDKALEDFTAALKLDPKSFAANLEKGRALLAAGSKPQAYQQINRSEALASGNGDLAALYYWRAQALEAIDEAALAQNDWKALLALPAEDVPAEWVSLAQARVDGLSAPTPGG